MSWIVGDRAVGDPVAATVFGTAFAGGVQLHIDVSFRVNGWPCGEQGPISIVPQPSEMRAMLDRSELGLGFAAPLAAYVMRPPPHSHCASVRFTLSLTNQALAALEAARDGRSLRLSMTLVAHALRYVKYPDFQPGVETSFLTANYVFDVPRDHWVGILQAVGFTRTLVSELRLPADGVEAMTPSRRRLAEAADARNLGGYADAMRRCRMALEELEKKGFGGKAPSDVVAFIKGKARKLTPVERLSALQAALEMFLSQAHHPNAPDEFYTREDADLSIAMTAALLRLWSVRVDDLPEKP